MYERNHQEVISIHHFVRRVARHFSAAVATLCVALGIGMGGYHFLDDLPWVDSFLNACMILGGMGPIDALKTTAAKLFAGFYALFAGLVFVGIAGVLIAPFAHRLLHRFHVPAK